MAYRIEPNNMRRGAMRAIPYVAGAGAVQFAANQGFPTGRYAKKAAKMAYDYYSKPRPSRPYATAPNNSTSYASMGNSQEIKSIKGKIKDLKKMDDATTGSLTYRRALTYRQIASDNAQDVFMYASNNTTLLEAVLAQTKYFNPAVPGTLTTGNSSSGTYQRKMYFESSTLKLNLRNNYQTPAQIDVYLCKVKDDTDQDVATAWNAAVPDGSNLTDYSELNQYPTDYNLVNDLYKLKKVKSMVLQPGLQVSVSHSEKGFTYDPATTDTHNLAYQKEYKAFQFLVIVKGVIAHDTALDEQGLVKCGVDIERHDIIKLKYSAGINIAYTYVLNTYNSFTNGSVIANKPVSDNQGFSIS